MEKFKTLADAVAITEVAHRNQVDQAGFPYVEHPKRVLASVQAMGAPPFVQIAALFHDVPEDTAFSHDILAALGFSPAVTVLTKLLDRGHSANTFEDVKKFWRPNLADTYRHFFQYESGMDKDDFYYANIAANPHAKMIKLADIRDNLTPWRLSYLPEKRQAYLVDKYDKALRALGES